MSKFTRREFLRLSTVAAVGALAAACAKTEAPAATPEPKEAAPTATPKPEEPTATPKPEEPTPTPEPAAKPWPREDVPRNRTYIRSFGYSGGVMDQPGMCGGYCAGFSHQQSGSFYLEPLAYYSAFDDKSWMWLAESYEYNDDATECTIHIRKGVEWSDGEPFGGKDLAFTMNMLVEHAPELRSSADFASWIESIDLVDDYTVKVSLNAQDWRHFYKFWTFRFDQGTYVVPEHIYKDVEDPLAFMFFDPEKGWPVVTGPFQPVEYGETHQYLDRRYDWWADKTGLMEMPKVERIIHVPMGTNENAAMQIINNEVDTTFMLPATLIKSIVERAPHVITHSGREKPYGYVDWWPVSMYFNTLEWPFDDPRVRWAIAYAINQQELVEVGQQGSGYISDFVFPTFPPLMRYHEAVDDIQAEYNVLEVDLQKSADLMMEAGFEKDDEGYWVKDGQRPECDLIAPDQHFGDIAPLVAEHMQNAGFDAKHLSPPDVWDQCATTALLHFFGHHASVIDPYRTMQWYESKWVTPTGENCGLNRTRWSNADYDAVVDEMAVTPMDDYEALEDQVHRAFEIWFKELPEVPLVQFMHRIPYNTTYWENWPTAENPYINGADFHLTGAMLLWGGIGLQPTE